MLPEPNFRVRPDEFVGRIREVEIFCQALHQGLVTGRTASFAVLGDWGIGKSSLLLKLAALCSQSSFAMLPVFVSVCTDLALMIRDQFQFFGIEGMNNSVCFSAKPDYFAGTKALADPAVRFYTKFYLEPFTFEETIEYTRSVFGTSPDPSAIIAFLLSCVSVYPPWRARFIHTNSKRFGPRYSINWVARNSRLILPN
jgi:hypothetical protein